MKGCHIYLVQHKTLPQQWLSGRVLALRAEGHGFDQRPRHTKDKKMIQNASLLTSQHLRICLVSPKPHETRGPKGP